MRSSFAKDIFAQDLLCIYEKQPEHRNQLRSESRDVLAEIGAQINAGGYSSLHLEELLLQLARRLSRTKGKKVYGYLKADVKAIIDSIVDEIAKDNRIATLYDLWYEQRENVLRTYNSSLPERVPVSQNKEFKLLAPSHQKGQNQFQQLYREILSVADENGGKLKNRCIFFCDEYGTSATRS